MIILQIEHKVQDFAKWKLVFDSDPIGRKKSGVKRYRIFRPIEDEHSVIIDLEFDTLNDAEATLSALRNLWGKVEGTIMSNPQSRILKIVESADY